MQIDFSWRDPQQHSRQAIDEVLSHGSDQIAIACAFCTAGGVEILKRHVSRLRRPDSFLVVSSQGPTDLRALGHLDELAPERVFVHFGAQAPREIRAGRPLMHSKVFYARSGEDCRVWLGSNNLTVAATQGLNYEAAVRLTGKVYEEPMIDALHHLLACKEWAIPYRPDMVDDDDDGTERSNTLIVHAESAERSLSTVPTFVHLCLPTNRYDKELNPGERVILFIYPLGTLEESAPDPRMCSAIYEGVQTAKNFTADHPITGGIPAEWQEAAFVIEEVGSVYRVCPARPPSGRMTTQAVLKIEGLNDSLRADAYLVTKPKAEKKFDIDPVMRENIDEDMRDFLSPRPSNDGTVRYERATDLSRIIKLSQEDFLKYNSEFLTPVVESAFRGSVGADDLPQDLPREFIYRAKYRVSSGRRRHE